MQGGEGLCQRGKPSICTDVKMFKEMVRLQLERQVQSKSELLSFRDKIPGHHHEISVVWENQPGSGIEDGVVNTQSSEAKGSRFGRKP